MSSDETSKGNAGTIYLIVIQVVSRGLTFIGNQALLRYVSPGHLGLAVQLESLSISVLYTARESLRVALQRSNAASSNDSPVADKKDSIQASVNAGYGVVGLGSFLGALFSFLYLSPASPDLLKSADFWLAFWLYSAATVLELSSEPYFVVIQQYALFKERARAETTAAIARCLTACLTVLVMQRSGMEMSVLPFAVGQLFYGLSLFATYGKSAASIAASGHFSLLPKKLTQSSSVIFDFFSRPLFSLAVAFYGQSIFKWLLTQGDTLVLSIFANLQSQGIFALASNYGGLASRLLFQPVEESSRNVFGTLTSTSKPNAGGTKLDTRSSGITPRRQQALEYLSTNLHAYMLIVIIPCTTILPRVFPLLVSTLLGAKSQWSSVETSALLSAYSYYIPCLAINGILDAFVTSVASEAELGAQSLMMVGVTMIYLSAAYLAMTVMQFGAVGLVYANILNMILRIIFSLCFVKAWTVENLPDRDKAGTPSPFSRFVRRSLPNKACLSAFAVAVVGLQAQDYVKVALADNATVVSLAQTKLGRINVDLFDLSYLFTATVIVGSSILLTEWPFLVGVIEPLVPRRLRPMLEPYLKPAKRD